MKLEVGCLPNSRAGTDELFEERRCLLEGTGVGSPWLLDGDFTEFGVESRRNQEEADEERLFCLPDCRLVAETADLRATAITFFWIKNTLL
ncbi:MAG: hypothetical protein ACHBN1_16290 [Heteroscytonema crispum UTEX LB 1556]